MSHFSKTTSAILKRYSSSTKHKHSIRSAVKLAQEYEKVMMDGTGNDTEKVIVKNTVNKLGNPFYQTPVTLTAGGWHDKSNKTKQKDGKEYVNAGNTNQDNDTPLWKKRPYLTASGRHEEPPRKDKMSSQELDSLVINIENYLDKHYLSWKKRR